MGRRWGGAAWTTSRACWCSSRRPSRHRSPSRPRFPSASRWTSVLPFEATRGSFPSLLVPHHNIRTYAHTNTPPLLAACRVARRRYKRKKSKKIMNTNSSLFCNEARGRPKLRLADETDYHHHHACRQQSSTLAHGTAPLFDLHLFLIFYF